MNTILTGLLSTNIQNVANSIIQSGTSNLGSFPSILNSSVGAVGSSDNFQRAINSSMQVFGKATGNMSGIGTQVGIDTLIAATNNNNERNTVLGGSYSEGVEGQDGILETFRETANNVFPMTLPYAEALNRAVSSPVINGFSSLFMDYNSMVTQGLGNLTDSLNDLGNDLRDLGRIGDLTDLFNIGTAHQLARQIIENGLGISSGLTVELQKRGLTVTSMLSAENQVREILNSLTDPTVLTRIKEVFMINPLLSISSVGDLLKPVVVFPRSYNYNRFTDIRDMAMTLALANDGIGELRSFGDLGSVMIQMETVETSAALLDEYTTIRADEVEMVRNLMPTESWFDANGPTLADFIGTAAGYVHADHLPRLTLLQNEVYDHALLDAYKSLMTLLTDTLSGVYTSGMSITVPTTSGYTFGVYTTLDSAAIAVKTAIESELANIATTARTTYPDLYQKIMEMETLHQTMARYLVHEEKMRKAYGVELGNSEQDRTYGGDGSTITFPIDYISNATSITVIVDGVFKIRGIDWDFDATESYVVFNTSPANGTTITINYNLVVDNATSADAWQLASQLESYALQTGYGGPADFLSRVASYDMHGQRMKAIMIQARNKARLESVGIDCTGCNRVLNENDSKNFNFVERTGIWSTNPDRAAEIWLQRNEEVQSIEEYAMNRLYRSASVIKPDNDLLMANVTRRMIFLSNDQLVISEETAVIYSNSSNNGLFLASRPDMVFSYNKNVPTEGFVLGNYREILSEICKAEGFSDPNFNVPLSTATADYLKKIGVDIPLLTSVFQRTLIVSLSASLGISEEDAVDMFGVQSISKNILANIANHY